MKRFVRSCLVLTLAVGALVASGPMALADPQVKGLPAGVRNDATTYSVTLAGTPAGQMPFTLTAKVMQSSAFTMSRAATPLVDPRLRYTFKAQRTWPCADTNVSLADTTTQSTVTWNGVGAKAGEYTVFTVHVTALQPTGRIGLNLPALPEVIGDATLSTLPSNVTVRPTGSVATVWDVSPLAGTTGPVTAYVTSKVNFPPEFTKFRFKITCFPYCQPASGIRELDTQASYPLITTIAPPAGGQSGGTQLNSWVDQVHVPDCLWVGSTQAYKVDYWIKAP